MKAAQKLFLKVVSSILASSLLYSQLLFAADPRDILTSAKASFEEEGARLGSHPLGPAEAVARQNALEELIQNNPSSTANSPAEPLPQRKSIPSSSQNTTQFMLTTPGGDTLNYVNGKLDSIQTKDINKKDVLLTNVLFDGQKILSANIHYDNGGENQVYQGGGITRYELPNGDTVFYKPSGDVDRVVPRNAPPTLYTYVRDAQNNLLSIVLENPDYKSVYDKTGLLLSLLNKKTGGETLFKNGMIAKIKTPGFPDVDYGDPILKGGEYVVTPQAATPQDPLPLSGVFSESAFKMLPFSTSSSDPWLLPEGRAWLGDQGLLIQGTGKDWLSMTGPLEQTPTTASQVTTSIDFSNLTLNSYFMLGMEGQGKDGTGRRFAVYQEDSAFYSQTFDGKTWTSKKILDYKHGTEYTAEFVYKKNSGIDLYLYPRSSSHPELTNPTATVRIDDWKNVNLKG